MGFWLVDFLEKFQNLELRFREIIWWTAQIQWTLVIVNAWIVNNLSLVNIFGETGRFFYNINYMLNSEHLSLVNKIGDKTEFTITKAPLGSTIHTESILSAINSTESRHYGLNLSKYICNNNHQMMERENLLLKCTMGSFYQTYSIADLILLTNPLAVFPPTKVTSPTACSVLPKDWH